MSALAKLQRIEKALGSIQAEHQKQQSELLQDHLDARAELLQRRFELVSGQSAATDEELKDYTGPRTTGPIKPQGVPCFWLNALCADAEVAACITTADRAALTYLQDVRYIRGKGGVSWSGMMLEFHFAENPFFENKVLRKGISVSHSVDGQVAGVSEEGTRIDWKDDQSLLVRKIKVKGKKAKRQGGKRRAGKGAADPTPQDDDTATLTRVKAVPSFFRFFTPLQKPKVADPTIDIDDDEGHDDPPSDTDLPPPDSEGDEGGDSDPEATAKRIATAAATQRRAQRDMAVLNAIVKRVIPRAVHLYLAAPQGPGADDDDDSDWGYQVVSSAAAAAHGGGAALPAASQQALHVITRLQSQLDALCGDLKRAKWALAQTKDLKEQELLDERASIVRGQAGKTGLSLFWLRALRASDASAAAIAHRDELALSHLVDVRVRLDWSHMPTREEPWRKAKVEWTFLDSPYFPATTLVKDYTLQCQHGSASSMSLDQAGAVLTAPQWTHPRPPHDPTTHIQEDDSTPGQCDLTLNPSEVTNSKKKQPQPVPATSFFNMFKQGCLRHTFSHVHESDSANPDEAALQAEGFLIQTLLNELRYKPTELYELVETDLEDLGHEYNEEEDVSVDDSQGGDEEHSEQGDSQQDEGDSNDEGVMASRPRRRPKAQRSVSVAGGWGKYYVFLALMMLMVAAQVVLYIDMFTSKKR